MNPTEILEDFQNTTNRLVSNLQTIKSTDSIIKTFLTQMNNPNISLGNTWIQDKEELDGILSDNKNYEGFTQQDITFLRSKLTAIISLIDDKLPPPAPVLQTHRSSTIGPGSRTQGVGIGEGELGKELGLKPGVSELHFGSRRGGKIRYKKRRSKRSKSKRRKSKRNRKSLRRKY
jgi:hypothetical protein